MLQTVFLFAYRRSRWHAPGNIRTEDLPEPPAEQSSASMSTASLR